MLSRHLWLVSDQKTSHKNRYPGLVLSVVMATNHSYERVMVISANGDSADPWGLNAGADLRVQVPDLLGKSPQLSWSNWRCWISVGPSQELGKCFKYWTWRIFYRRRWFIVSLSHFLPPADRTTRHPTFQLHENGLKPEREKDEMDEVLDEVP